MARITFNGISLSGSSPTFKINDVSFSSLHLSKQTFSLQQKPAISCSLVTGYFYFINTQLLRYAL